MPLQAACKTARIRQETPWCTAQLPGVRHAVHAVHENSQHRLLSAKQKPKRDPIIGLRLWRSTAFVAWPGLGTGTHTRATGWNTCGRQKHAPEILTHDHHKTRSLLNHTPARASSAGKPLPVRSLMSENYAASKHASDRRPSLRNLGKPPAAAGKHVQGSRPFRPTAPTHPHYSRSKKSIIFSPKVSEQHADQRTKAGGYQVPATALSPKLLSSLAAHCAMAVRAQPTTPHKLLPSRWKWEAPMHVHRRRFQSKQNHPSAVRRFLITLTTSKANVSRANKAPEQHCDQREGGRIHHTAPYHCPTGNKPQLIPFHMAGLVQIRRR